MAFELKDPTFSWVEWLCLIAFSIGLLLAIMSKNTSNLLIFSLTSGVFFGRLIHRWDKKAKLVAQLMMFFCCAGLFIASFNVLSILALLLGMQVTIYLEKNKLVSSTSF